MNSVNAKLNGEKSRQRFLQRSSNMAHNSIRFVFSSSSFSPFFFFFTVWILIFYFVRSCVVFIGNWVFLYDAACITHLVQSGERINWMWKRPKANQTQYWAYAMCMCVCVHWNAKLSQCYYSFPLLLRYLSSIIVYAYCLFSSSYPSSLYRRFAPNPALSLSSIFELALKKVAIWNHARRQRSHFRLCIKVFVLFRCRWKQTIWYVRLN